MRKPLVFLATMLVPSIALTGCGVFGEQTRVPAAVVERLDVPDDMLRREPTVSLSHHIAAPSEHHPWVLGGTVTEPGGHAAPTIWTSANGSDWSWRTMPEVSGSFSGMFRSSPDLLALGGVEWVDGERRSRLWTSTAGEVWQALALPSGFSEQYWLWTLAVGGASVVAVGEDNDGLARGLVATGATVTDFGMPDANGQPLNVLGVGFDGHTIVLLAAPGPEGEPAPIVSYASDDHGRSWSGPSAFTGPFDRVSGIVAVEDGFVVTGSATRSDGDQDAAAWFTTDGLTWSRESVPPAEHGWLLQESGDRSLGTPTESGGIVGAMMSHDSSLLNGIYRRTPEGTWSWIAATDRSKAAGDSGAVVHTADGSSLGIVSGHGGARVGRVDDGDWRVRTVLSHREDLLVAESASGHGDGILIEASVVEFRSSEHEWTRRSVSSHFTIDADTVVEIPSGVPEELEGVKTAIHEGAQVALGHDVSSNAPSGRFRPAPNAEWISVTGLPTDVLVEFEGVARLADRWLAFGYARPGLSSRDRLATLLTSYDGVTWEDTSPTRTTELDTAIFSVCTLPDATPLAFGYQEYEPNRLRAAIWTLHNGAWELVDGGVVTASDGFADHCVTTDDGILLRAQVEGRASLYLGTSHDEWSEVLRPSRGSWIDVPTRVTGGFAASGHHADGRYSEPVIWLSADASSWHPVSVPSDRDAGLKAIAPLGDDLLVLMNGAAGHPIMVIRDIGSLIASLTG